LKKGEWKGDLGGDARGGCGSYIRDEEMKSCSM